jgi:large-conductance mechanosensitive channel
VAYFAAYCCCWLYAGTVVELAVAVVLGTAFTSLLESVTKVSYTL